MSAQACVGLSYRRVCVVSLLPLAVPPAMPRNKPSYSRLSPFARGQICAFRKAGWKREQICKTIKKRDGTHPCLRAVAAVLTKHAAEPKWEGEDSKAGGRPRALTVRQAKELVDLVFAERGKVKVTTPYCRRRLPFLRKVLLAHINCAATCLSEGPFVSGLSLVRAYSAAFACSMAFIIWPGVSGDSQAGVTASWLGVAASPKEDGGAEGLGAQAHCLLQVVAEACPCRSASLCVHRWHDFPFGARAV